MVAVLLSNHFVAAFSVLFYGTVNVITQQEPEKSEEEVLKPTETPVELSKTKEVENLVSGPYIGCIVDFLFHLSQVLGNLFLYLKFQGNQEFQFFLEQQSVT